MIEPDHNQLSISKQCEFISLPRSSFYRETHAVTETRKNLGLMRLIDEEFMRHPFLGTRKMCNYLRRAGYRINRKRVQRLMRKMGLASFTYSGMIYFFMWRSLAL